MKNLLPALVAAACLIPLSSVQAAADAAKARNGLVAVLTCNQAVNPSDFSELIKAAGGKAIVQASDLSDGEYTLPTAIQLFGQPVTKLSAHPASGEGDYNEYTAVIENESVSTIAARAGIVEDIVGDYRKEVGSHDLVLRDEATVTMLSCVNGVRSISQRVKDAASSLTEAVGR